jgi:hypothetical protein
MNLRYAPIVPQQAPRQTDRQWMAAYVRRHGGESQNAALSRAATEASLRAERRRAGNYRVTRLLNDAALDNDIAAYQRSRTETMGLISRLRQRSDPYAAYASRSALAAECTGPDCPVCATARQLEASRRREDAGHARGMVSR